MCDKGSWQAAACWRWANFLESLKGASQPVLHINLDETSLKLFIPPRPGFVVDPSPKRRRRLLHGRGSPDMKTKRAAVTLVAFACDNDRVQKLLPQVFLVNEHVVTKDDVNDLRAKCQGNVLVSRRKSSWVNAAVMVELVGVLSAILKKNELQNHHVVLHMDAFSAHLHESVLQACAAAGMHLHIIPASCTSSLQPLDVSVFRRFKRWVADEVERRCLASAQGQLLRAETLEVWRLGVDAVIRSQGWRRAFEQCGLLGQLHMSEELTLRAGVLPVGSDAPSLADLQAIYPARRDIPIEMLFKTALEQERAARAVRIPTRARLPRGRL